MALDTLGVVSREYRKRLLLRNLVNSDDPSRLFNLGLALTLPAQYTTQQSDSRQFIASAISIKNFIKNTFSGDEDGLGDNTTTRAFLNQDYTYDKPYPLGSSDNEPLRSAEDQITEFPPPQRKTYDVSGFDKGLNINGLQGLDTQNIPDQQKLKRETKTKSNISQFYWKKDDNFDIGDKKDLLSFTQSILKNYKSDSIGKVIDQSQTVYQKPDGTGDYTKGSNIKKIGDPQQLAREFSVEKPYSKISDLISNEKPYMMSGEQTALDDSGFPRISPRKNDWSKEKRTAPKNLMFSIENLAWQEYATYLPCLEAGPFGGRLMWFPPYGIAITDNSSVNWASTSFVGRGEPIYTYNNAERTMTLQFKVLTDHPSVLNAVKEQSKISVEQFFSDTGAKDDEGKGGVKETIESAEYLALKYQKMQKAMPADSLDKAEVENNRGQKIADVDSSFSLPTILAPQTVYFSANTIDFASNVTGNTKNAGFDIDKFVTDLYSIIDKIKIIIKGSSSNTYTFGPPCLTGMTKDTQGYGENRANDALLYLQQALTAKLPSTNPPKEKQDAINNLLQTSKTGTKTTPFAEGCESDNFQSVNIITEYDPSKDSSLIPFIDPKVDQTTLGNSRNSFLRRTVPLCESEYFEAMKKEDRFALYSNLKDRLNFFHPSFHSITPEGFNSRLTFLLQCTRQGPSIQNKTGPTNMAFGRPPICILRIGDFYYTKVVIDSVNISYDDNLFDLNPTGIGIQPMIATVDLNMKVIGGSSLEGPDKAAGNLGEAATRLQNALSYHFFANTEVYMDDFFSQDLIQTLSKKDKDAYGTEKEEIKDESVVGGDGGAATEESFVKDPASDPPEATEPVGIFPSGFTSNFFQCTLRQDGEGLGFLQGEMESKTPCEEYNEGYFLGKFNGTVVFSEATDKEYTLQISLISSDAIQYPLLTETAPKGINSHQYIWGSSEGIKLKDQSTYSVKVTIMENMNSKTSSAIKFNKSDCSLYCKPCCP